MEHPVVGFSGDIMFFFFIMTDILILGMQSDLKCKFSKMYYPHIWQKSKI